MLYIWLLYMCTHWRPERTGCYLDLHLARRRRADGRAVLRSSLREFVASEAMAALGVRECCPALAVWHGVAGTVCGVTELLTGLRMHPIKVFLFLIKVH
jgi:hypothetical protein